jgi:serpin B
MPIAFSDFADFSGISPVPLKITDVIHKAFIGVNEAGTEAGAATAVVSGVTSVPPPPIPFRMDHPFAFLIRDSQTGSVLFMGRVTRPAAMPEPSTATLVLVGAVMGLRVRHRPSSLLSRHSARRQRDETGE